MLQLNELFKQTVKNKFGEVDPLVLSRHMKAWKKETAGNKDVVSLQASIAEYVDKHIPQDGDVPITGRLSQWARELGISSKDTLKGYYVTPEDSAAIEQARKDYALCRELFTETSEDVGIVFSYEEYFRFLQKNKAVVHKFSFHPDHSGQEYFYDTTSEGMDRALNRWISIQLSDRPAEDPAYCSLTEMSRLCSTSIEELLDWMEMHPDKITLRDGAVLIDAVFCRDVHERLKDVRTVASLGPCLYHQYPLFEKRVIDETMVSVASQPGISWLLTPQDLPPSKIKKPSYLIDREAEVVEAMTSALEHVCAIPAKTIREMTGLSLEGLTEKVRSGIIDAAMVGKTYYISPAEVKRIEQICEKFVSLDTVIENMAEKMEGVTYQPTRHRARIAGFLEEHAYWGVPTMDADTTVFDRKGIGKVIKKTDIPLLDDGLRRLLNGLDKSTSEKIEYLLQEFQQVFPQTVKQLRKFIRTSDCGQDSTILNMLQVLFSELEDLGCELYSCDERTICEIVDAFGEVSRSALECFASFLIFGKFSKRRYTPIAPSASTVINCAYTKNDFSVMVAHVVNQEVLEKKTLVKKALDCAKFSSLWLYIALHVFAAWRSTDYKRMDPPHLPDWDWREIENKLRTGTFSDNDALRVADSFISLYDIMARTPNKTQAHRDVPRLYFYCPQSCRVPFGTILAIRWVHYQKNAAEGSFVEVVNGIELIRRFFGDDMVKACGNRHFSGRRANKALMQAVEMTVRGNGESTAALAYLIASVVRSHKGSLDKLPESTDVYLRDGNFSNYTPEFVVDQMYQRQTCSFVVDNLLELSYGASYRLLSASDKTKCITSVGMHVSTLMDLVSFAQQAQIEAMDVAKEISMGRDVHEVLCSIIVGNAAGKERDDICVRSAAGMECCDQTRVSCLGCKYEIKTKALLLPFLVNHHKLHQEYCELKERRTAANQAFQENRMLALMADVKKHISEIMVYVNSGAYGTPLSEEEKNMYLELNQAVKGDIEKYGLGSG